MSLQESAKEELTAAAIEQPTCHMLPCSIDFSGRLPGAAHFFQPTPLEEDSCSETSQGRVLAATLRGRGMLGKETFMNDVVAASSEDSPPSAALCVFKVGAGTLTVEGSTINKVVEWNHEHNIDNLKHVKSRLDTARAWMQISHALHDPLPPPEEF